MPGLQLTDSQTAEWRTLQRELYQAAADAAGALVVLMPDEPHVRRLVDTLQRFDAFVMAVDAHDQARRRNFG